MPEAFRISSARNLSELVVPALLEAYDFSGINQLVDIAGGHGQLLAGILKQYPDLRGTLFDLPFVIKMLCVEGGKERTEKEFNELLQAAGFVLTNRTPTKSPMSIIEAKLQL